MSPRSKREYTEAIHLRYKNATHHEKTIILDEFCATCGCHRKHAISKGTDFKSVPNTVQALYKTKGKEKRETNRLST